RRRRRRRAARPHRPGPPSPARRPLPRRGQARPRRRLQVPARLRPRPRPPGVRARADPRPPLLRAHPPRRRGPGRRTLGAHPRLPPRKAALTDHRAAFDASITFANGGDLTVHDFRVDVPSPHVTDDEIAALFVASLGLLMTDAVELSNVRVFPEPHKGTRGGPSDHTTAPPPRGRIHPLDTPATRSELPRAVSLPAADALRARADVPETATAAADELAAPHGEAPAGASRNGTTREGTWASRESQAGEGELAAAHGETPETAVAELGGTAAGTGSDTSVTSAEQAGAHEEVQADFVRTVELRSEERRVGKRVGVCGRPRIQI